MKKLHYSLLKLNLIQRGFVVLIGVGNVGVQLLHLLLGLVWQLCGSLCGSLTWSWQSWRTQPWQAQAYPRQGADCWVLLGCLLLLEVVLLYHLLAPRILVQGVGRLFVVVALVGDVL